MFLNSHLAQLEITGLVSLIRTQPELEYLFRHALIQDAAYGSLVKHDRKRLHLAVGEALERTRLDDTPNGELAPLLARHFDEAGDAARALKYFTLAGDAAARVYANVEAAAHYARAIGIAARSPDVDAGTLARLYQGRGQALELSSRHAEALATYDEMETTARARADRSMELAAIMSRAKVYSTLNAAQNPEQARVLLDRSLTLARELGDRAAECKVLWNLMLVFLWSGDDQRQAIGYGEQALALARELDLREQIAFTLNDLAYAYMSIRQWPRAWAALDESRALWRESGNLPMLADNVANSVLLHLRAGHFHKAVASADEALAISRSIGNVWGQAGSQAYSGLVYLEYGEPDRAISIMQEAIRLGDQVGHPAPTIATRCDLGWAYGTLGAFERAFELVRTAQARAGETLFLRVMPLAVLAQLHLLTGDLDAAEAALQAGYRELKPEGLQWFGPILLPLAEAELALARGDASRAIDVMGVLLADLREEETRYLLADALCLKGSGLAGMNRTEEAYAALLQARAEAEAVGSRRALWKILASLSKLEASRGHAAEAQALRDQARAIVEYVAEHTPPELRASFRALPHIRALFQDPGHRAGV